MKTTRLHLLCLLAMAAGCPASHAGTTQESITFAGKTLVLQPATKCARAQRSGKELARYLSQYDPSADPREDIRDETPWSREEIESIKASLIEQGFRYPGGRESVITWMDFDGDGVCDFTASAGNGGTHSTDRMFLFRGLPGEGFRLVDAYATYMEGSSIVVPYIPITVSGEKLPVLATTSTLLQWQGAQNRFATCESIAYGPKAASERAMAPALSALCPRVQKIIGWAADQLPGKNEVPYSTAD